MLKTSYTWLVGGRYLQYYYHFNSVFVTEKTKRNLERISVRVHIWGVCVYVCIYIIITRISQYIFFYEHWTLYRKFFFKKNKTKKKYSIQNSIPKKRNDCICFLMFFPLGLFHLIPSC